jgi:hypothetical protein
MMIRSGNVTEAPNSSQGTPSNMCKVYSPGAGAEPPGIKCSVAGHGALKRHPFASRNHHGAEIYQQGVEEGTIHGQTASAEHPGV